MAVIRAVALAAAMTLSGILLGCGAPAGLDLSESPLEEYARDADEICVESFQRGLAGEESAEELGEQLGWSGPRIEAEIRYAWAYALKQQYRQIEELGPAPEQAGVAERWARSALERARLYRRIGDAWLESDRGSAAELDGRLRLAKITADHLAGPLPFQVCGRPVPGAAPEEPDRSEQVARPSLIHTAEFPLSSAPALRRVVGVYWRHQVAGHVVRRTRGTETILVEIHLKPGYARRAPGTDLRLFRGRRDPAVTWIAMVPRN